MRSSKRSLRNRFPWMSIARAPWFGWVVRYGWVVPVAAGVTLWMGHSEQADAEETVVFQAYDVRKGELSPGTQAPTSAQLVSTINTGSASAIQAALEYGERVACYECIPLLEAKLLQDERPLVREMAAWWLRRRPFGAGQVVRNLRAVLQDTSASSVDRVRAAEALGEFMEVKSFEPLVAAAQNDADATVRLAAVRALTRLNHGGIALSNALKQAMGDPDSAVRQAALQSATTVRGFDPGDASEMVSALRDADAATRRRAAHALGRFRVASAVSSLGELLQRDSDRGVRQACAWALGRIGSTEAKQALAQAQSAETDSLVRDSIAMGL
jgi:hypothetical protein